MYLNQAKFLWEVKTFDQGFIWVFFATATGYYKVQGT